MKYRMLGATGLKVSEISLGTEYLINIPEDEAIQVIGEAIDRGINYFDLFFAQPGFRDTMAKALDPCREKVILAAHLGAVVRDGQYDRSRDVKDCEHYFHDFLTRYHTDYADVLFLHNSDGDEDFKEIMKPGGLYESALELKKQGKCRHIGFSTHTVESGLKAIEVPGIGIIMFPVNLASHAVPGKEAFYRRCAEKNIGLVAMKPYAGGKLLQEQSRMELENVHSAGGKMVIEKTTRLGAADCLAYVLSRTGLSCVVPGCASVKHLEEALAYYEREDRDFSLFLEEYGQFTKGECTYCNHCLPCPVGIDIGQSLRLADMAASGVSPELTKAYRAMDTAPSACIRCGACEARCPFDVATMDRLARSAASFETA